MLDYGYNRCLRRQQLTNVPSYGCFTVAYEFYGLLTLASEMDTMVLIVLFMMAR